MSDRLLAIGDVHGCRDALATLLEVIAPTDNDELVMLGDYIDRGPDSRGVIDLLLGLRQRCRLVTILGNHEEMMLSVLSGKAPAPWWLQHGGLETLDSYGFTGDLACIPAEHVAFLKDCVDYHTTPDFFFVHANYVAAEPPEDQPVEALRWQSLDAQFPERHVSGRTAIVGHTAQQSHELLDAGYLRCLDTHCYAGGWLTAQEVRTGETWQASAEGRLRQA